MGKAAEKPPLRRWQWNSAEDAAFDDDYFEYPEDYQNRALSALCVVLYLRGFRCFMDYETGLVGVRRRISYQMFIELLEELSPLGSNKTGFRPTIDQVRWMIKELIRVGLMEKLPAKRRTDPMVFRMVLATVDVVRLNEESQMSPIGGVPEENAAVAGAGVVKRPSRVPRGESHTSEAPKLKPKRGNKLPLSSTCSCPHADILKIWDEVMPVHISRPKPTLWKSGRKAYKDLRLHWKAGFVTLNDKDQLRYIDLQGGLDWWRGYFKFLRSSAFLTNGEHRNFSLPWILKSENMIKALEGDLHDK